MLSFNDFSSASRKTNVLPPDESPEQAEDSTSQKKSDGQKPSVLIFGADTDVRFLLKTILEIWNFDFMEADTVEQSINIAEEKHPDVVLMDTELVFSDSFSKMRKMRKCALFKEVPFILLSGHAQDDIRLMALAAGAADFFVKPVNLDLLENTLKSHLPNKDRVGNPGDFR
jgi:DNA-binding response OmpR family regulator